MKRRSADVEESPKPDGRRRRSTRGTLRKNQEIDHIRVEETFALKDPASSNKVGDACYVSATINNRRLYGTLVDQDALKAASVLYMQDAARALDTTRRMKIMKQRQNAGRAPTTEENDSKPSAASDSARTTPDDDVITSHQPLEERVLEDATVSDGSTRRVQKFRYVNGDTNHNSAHRVLLATYADLDAAAEDNRNRRMAIEAACLSGGDFVGTYYYQFEARPNSLNSSGVPTSIGASTRGLRQALGYHIFLQQTPLPEWYPLSYLEVGRGIKKDQNGMLVWEEDKPGATQIPQTIKSETTQNLQLIPMKPRSAYRVVVVGGGIAGLSACLELLQACDRDGVQIEVSLVEGRSRLGGRLWTDRNTFKGSDQTPFPVDLGASWIHGIDSNPLAAMAQEAKVDFVRTSEKVAMLREGERTVDPERDDHAGEMFDKLLDLAVETCWQDYDGTGEDAGVHPAVRWYASEFTPTDRCTDSNMGNSVEFAEPRKILTGPHRDSTDTSVDDACGRVLLSGKLSEIASLSEEERRMLRWNTKNIEFALGANLSDLSMKFWDIDERHAFEGDHVILKQGYSAIVEHIHDKLKQFGSRFTCLLDSPVQRIEYARNTTCNPYFCPSQYLKSFVELSDTCQVVLESGAPPLPCDFVVCAVPLGVLKDAVSEESGVTHKKLEFEPPLPFSKKDAIKSVGFGLLDKVYLQFPEAFWRHILEQGQTSFGNASSCNPQHYIFFDVGLSMEKQPDIAPAILMTLISGRDAALSECLSENELKAEVVRTLRILFGARVPEPISFKVTRWGRDRFSRGSYSFLGPGTTDQDFRLLQSPINGNGDSIILEGNETMRLFFAGEHTTSLHPSMAHGAMLSGIRVAKEVVQALTVTSTEVVDKTIPLALFRHLNPKGILACVLCHLPGSRVREGSLLAFKRGARYLCIHNNCAENSPEVGVKDGVWSNVIRACNRGKAIVCSLCGQIGATIGCSTDSCTRSYHFSCAEDTGWRFEEDGKEFRCDSHRTPLEGSRKISVEYFLLRAENGQLLTCALCGDSSERESGELLAFQNGNKRIVVHECCIRYTSTFKASEKTSSPYEKDFENVFESVASAQKCERCSRDGASIKCAETSCAMCYHFHCAKSLDWDFGADKQFRCFSHRNLGTSIANGKGNNGEEFQHTLFSLLSAGPSEDMPSNLGTGRVAEESMHDDPVPDAKIISINHFRTEKLTIFEGDTRNTRLVSIARGSQNHAWNLSLEAAVDQSSGGRVLSVSAVTSSTELSVGDVVCTMNGVKVGTPTLDTVEKVLKVLAQEVEIFMEVCDGTAHSGHDDAWGE